MIKRTPSTLPGQHRVLLTRVVEVIAVDPRVVGIAAAGSFADDTMDEFSDLDLIIAVEPDHLATIMPDRQRIASEIGDLLVSFTGEHVGEPRLLICLFGSPLVHVDLKFVALLDAAARVDDPIVLWERDGRLTLALAAGQAHFPCPDMQWVEDRFWVWIHYVASKVGRGELFEAVEFLSFLRSNVFGPLGKRQLGLQAFGVRRLEALAPQLANELKATVASLDAGSILAAIRASVCVYHRLLAAHAGPLQRRTVAEREATAYLEAIEQCRISALDNSHTSQPVARGLGQVALVVREYDEAIDFYVGKLGFSLIEDSYIPEQDKRWVVVAPPGPFSSRLLLCRADGPEQRLRIGNQTGGRVFLFLYSDDFERDYRAYREKGVIFVREPKKEAYGTVAVFQDLYGNLWDLLQLDETSSAKNP